METLSSPNENVAQKALIIVSSATTKIKEAITKGLIEGNSQDEITKVLNKTIATYCKQINNLQLQEETRRSLVVSARKWYYQLNQTIRILKRNALNGLAQDGTVYAVDIKALLNNVDGVGFNQLRPLLDQSKKGLAIIENYNQKLKVAIKALAAEPPKVITVSHTETRKGYTYTMSLRNRAEMMVRYDANLRDLDNLISKGVEYVWTTSHPDASPRCAPYQGKLYSLNPNNPSGVINGNRYTYLPDVLMLNEGNSIINGYNCRHRLVEYQVSSHAPNEYSKTEIKKEYANDQKQRYYENNIRLLKTEERLLRASGNTEDAKGLRLKWRRMNKQYEIESLKMNRAYFTWRTRISDDEEYYDAEIGS